MAEPEEEKTEQEKSPEQLAMEADIEMFAHIDVFGESEGGRILLQSLMKDVMSAIESIGNRYSSLTLPEFIAYGAEIKTKLDIVRSVTRAKKNKDEIMKILEESLQE